MSILMMLSSRPRALLIPLLLLLTVCGAVAFAVQAAGGPEPRQVTLLARGMAFYLPGDATPNPRLVVERGEEVRFVLRNEDRGMPHDLEVPEAGGDRKSTREVRGIGDTASLAFRAPETPGDYEYVCTLHSRMMRGVMEVR
jgi:copper binding plastocyanin/azurin family protein